MSDVEPVPAAAPSNDPSAFDMPAAGRLASEPDEIALRTTTKRFLSSFGELFGYQIHWLVAYRIFAAAMAVPDVTPTLILEALVAAIPQIFTRAAVPVVPTTVAGQLHSHFTSCPIRAA
jgi:hypothetical protein